MHRWRTFLSAALLFCLAAGAWAEDASLRTWTSGKGSAIEARFIRRTGGVVVLRSAAGEDMMIGLADLSKPDREYVEKLEQARLDAARKKLGGSRTRTRRPSAGAERPEYLTKTEYEVIEEMNFARTRPGDYVEFLRRHRSKHVGDGVFATDHGRIRSKEGVRAMDEAIAFMQKVKPVGALKPSKGLSLAAKSHADDIGPAGITGHTGSNGSTMKQRIDAQGRWKKTIGENISFGLADARDIVVQLIIDDGVPGRGHRDNIYKREFGAAGVNIGRHKGYGTCCVIDYAGRFSD